LRGNFSQQGKLLCELDVGLVDSALTRGYAGEQPLGRGYLFQVEPFGAVLRLPIGYEIGPELLVFLRVFLADEDATSTQPGGEGIEAYSGLALGSFRTGGLLRVLPVGFVLFIANYHMGFASGVWGSTAHARIAEDDVVLILHVVHGSRDIAALFGH
jgi:hypothetical protein